MTPKLFLAGETRFEHATSGFGDRCSTIEPLPFIKHFHTKRSLLYFILMILSISCLLFIKYYVKI